MKLNKININDILFFDIETIPGWASWDAVPDYVKKEWIYKFKFKDNAPPMYYYKLGPNNIEIAKSVNPDFHIWLRDLWNKEAALYAEFSRVCCIVVGYILKGTFRVKTYISVNEGELLTEFCEHLNEFISVNKNLQLCGHYIKGFDIPFLAKRMLINRIALPSLLDTYGLKPWEITAIDTQEIWKFGSGQSAGLPAISMAFGLPTSKDDIDGSQVAECFYNGELERIAVYCRKDVVSTLNNFKAMRLEEPLQPLQIEYV